jgi:hypothetical protein
MKLVVDANIMVGEMLRIRGRHLVQNPEFQMQLNAWTTSWLAGQGMARYRVALRNPVSARYRQ